MRRMTSFVLSQQGIARRIRLRKHGVPMHGVGEGSSPDVRMSFTLLSHSVRMDNGRLKVPASYRRRLRRARDDRD